MRKKIPEVKENSKEEKEKSEEKEEGLIGNNPASDYYAEHFCKGAPRFLLYGDDSARCAWFGKRDGKRNGKSNKNK